MQTEFLNVWTNSAEIIGESELKLTICLTRVRPIVDYRMNSFAGRFFISRKALPICDLDGNIIGRCVEPFRQTNAPTENNEFCTKVIVTDETFWKRFVANKRLLRCGLWASVVLDVHSKKGHDQVTIVHPGIEYLTLFFAEPIQRTDAELFHRHMHGVRRLVAA